MTTRNLSVSLQRPFEVDQKDPSALFGGEELAMFNDLSITELGELIKASHYLDFHRLEVLSSSLLAKVLTETDIHTLKVTLSSMH